MIVAAQGRQVRNTTTYFNDNISNKSNICLDSHLVFTLYQMF